MTRLLAIGGVHVDRRGRVSQPFIAGASNPGVMREEIGGGAFNAARTAVHCGVAASIMSVRGGDNISNMVADAIKDCGIRDLSAVFLDRATPSYTAILDERGDVVAALADMALYDIAFPKQMRRSKIREAIAASDAVLCDANLPHAALVSLRNACSKPIFAIAVSPAKVIRFRHILPSLSCLFMNRREAAALAGDGGGVKALRDLGLRSGVITDGGGDIIGFQGDNIFALKPPMPERVADVTGAGDAFAGAALAAMTLGNTFEEALRRGAASALLALQSETSVAPWSDKAFNEALGLVPQPRPTAETNG